MKLSLFCVFVIFFASQSEAQLDDDAEFPDLWKEYDDFYDYGMVKDEVEHILPKTEEDKQSDLAVQKDIEKFKNPDAIYEDFDNSYQIEDNRSNEDENDDKSTEEKEKLSEKQNIADDYNLLWGDSIVKDTKDKTQESTTKKDEESVLDEVIDKDPKAGADNDYHLLWGDDDMAPLPVRGEEDNFLDDNDKTINDKFDEAIPVAHEKEIDENLLKETLELLKEGENDKDNLDNLPLPIPNAEDLNNNILDATKTIQKDVDNLDLVPDNVKQNIEDIVDETKKLLEEDSSLNKDISEHKEEELEDEISKLADAIDKAEDELEEFEDANEDTVDGAMDDLNADLDKLFDTLDILRDGVEDSAAKGKEKLDKLFGSDENELANENNSNGNDDENYENIGDSNLSQIFAKIKSTTSLDMDENEDEREDNAANEELDDVIKDILEEENEINSSAQKIVNDNDKEPNSENDVESMQDDDDSKPKLMYLKDALLVGDSKEDDSLVEQFDIDDLALNDKGDEILDDFKESDNIDKMADDDENQKQSKPDESKHSTKMVDELTSDELEDLMDQFKIVHSDIFEVKSESSPIHVKLSVNEPVIITSPNYPNPYPTNNIIDWLFEGEGTGIELIIEDFAVNGALGDYLLVKPGRTDGSGQDGLVFSYRLNSERRYRFMDVNRMFVRFEARLGMMFMRGFKFSVRMISPPARFEEIHLPHPEDLWAPNEENLTLILGGLTIIDFHNVKAEFRQLLADMAERYIMENDVNPGLNTTSEVTKILKTAVCNIRWPDYENCVEVTFSVPLRYDNESAEARLNEDDLEAMWRSLYKEEPFALKLRDLGITEFSVPNDRSVIMAWMMITFGVVISMVMLAFALWRFSCFEDYTRMRAFDDSDSVKNEKRNLDLYPTPHQTLPPLYAESEYKWHDEKFNDSTRVDLGGYANKSYMREDVYGFDSEDDVVPSRDRYTTDV